MGARYPYQATGKVGSDREMQTYGGWHWFSPSPRYRGTIFDKASSVDFPRNACVYVV